jgi:hypothetical protein
MSGFLSKMFEPDATDGAQQGAHSEGQSNATDAHADTALDAEVTINLHTEMSVDYASGGEEGGWSQATDVSLTLSTDAALDLLAGASSADASTTAE